MSWRALLALSVLLQAPAAHADTLEEALAAAHRNNPTLEEARLAVRAARQDRVQAAAAYWPTLGVSASIGAQDVEIESSSIFGPSSNESRTNPRSTNVDLTQSLFTGGRRLGVTRLARANVEGAQQGLRATEQDILLAAVDAYLSVQRDEEVLRLRAQHVEGLTRQLAGTRRRLDVGEVSRTDLAQAQTRLAGARAALSRSRAELEASRARYEQIIGHAPTDLAPVMTLPNVAPTLSAAVTEAETQHPDLMRARSSERAAHARTTIERAALLPQVSITGRYEYSDDATYETDRREGTSAVARFSLPIFEGGLAASRARQSEINMQRAEALTEARRREIVANVASAWNNLLATREILDAAREQVETAELAVSGTERERGFGLRSTLDVLDAEEEAREAQVNRARAEAEATFAAFALSAATGSLALPQQQLAH